VSRFGCSHEPDAREASRQESVSREDALDAFVDALLEDDAEQLYEQAPCGYLSTTPDGTIVKVNQTFLTLTGYRREELVGKRRFVDLLTGGGRIYHETHFAPMLRMQGSAREIALDLVSTGGDKLPVLVNSVLERDPNGQPRLVRSAVFDATERRAYEQELVHQRERAEASEERATALARTLQATLIPPIPPRIPGLDLAAAYRPAGAGDEVGGDFYDVFQTGDGEWAVVLGDVCGKGAEAAVVTALLRYALRAAAMAKPDPVSTLKLANDVLRSHDGGRFCTALLLRLSQDERGWTATVCAAGHPLPLLLRADGTLSAVGEAGTLLGVLTDLEVTAHEVPLAPGDRLMLYTDGVTEARGEAGMYGEERLHAHVLTCAAESGAAHLVNHVLEDVMTFQQDWARDDIALLAIAAE
jgi:sigma-B regulation protein RsbU (phosphoserine phosphatase)